MNFKKICEDLMTRCLAPDCQMGGLGCDNMTVVLVCILNGDKSIKIYWHKEHDVVGLIKLHFLFE